MLALRTLSAFLLFASAQAALREPSPSTFIVIAPQDENLVTFEPSPGLFNFSDPDRTVVGSRSLFSGNLYNPLATPIELVPVGNGLQPETIPVPQSGVVGTYGSVSLVTRGLDQDQLNLADPSTFATITQISFTAFICVNEEQGQSDILNGESLGCFDIAYGGPFFNNPFDGQAPSPIPGAVTGGTGIFEGASGTVELNNLSNGAFPGVGVLEVTLSLDSDTPRCNLGQQLAGRCGGLQKRNGGLRAAIGEIFEQLP